MHRERMVGFLALALICELALSSPPARACTVAPYPFQPELLPASIIVRATVTKAPQTGEFTDEIVFTVDKVVLGKLDRKRLVVRQIDYSHGTCGSPFRDPKKGERLVVYVKKEVGKVAAVEAWFSSDDPDRELVARSARARKRQERWKLFHHMDGVNVASGFGALSRITQDEWLPQAERPSPIDRPRLGEVEFSVDANGKMVDCVVVQTTNIEAFDSRVCAILEARARLVPPIFPEERRGHLDIR